MQSSSSDSTKDSGTGGGPKDKNTDARPATANWNLKLPDIPAGWVIGAVGAVVLLAIPFYKTIFRIGAAAEKAAENAAKVVEEAAEVVEKSAEAVENLASEIAAVLPDGNLKERATRIQFYADQVDNSAERTQTIIHQVDLLKNRLIDEVQPIIEQEQEIEKGIQPTVNLLEKPKGEVKQFRTIINKEVKKVVQQEKPNSSNIQLESKVQQTRIEEGNGNNAMKKVEETKVQVQVTGTSSLPQGNVETTETEEQAEEQSKLISDEQNKSKT